MKNLVMGVAKGYGWNELEPFVISCKKNCPDADLVLFVNDISGFTEKNLSRAGVQVQQVPEYLNSKLIIDARWEMYKMYLDAHPEYEKIFVADTRDVLFQSDLFSKYAAENFLVYATEDATIQNDIPGATANVIWIRRLFGEEELNRLKDKIIICCGTVYATRAEMHIFLDKMIEMLKRSTAWGDEQAAMNYLVHNKLLPIENLIESSVKSGEILTVGLVGAAKCFKVDAEKVLRKDGGIPAVVHQYDRYDEVNQFVDKIYRESDLQADGIFLDIRSTLDQIFCLVQRKNFSEATKLFVNNVLYDQDPKPYGEKLLKLYELLLKRYNSDAEILLSALQRVLAKAFSVNLNHKQLEALYRIFVSTDKNVHIFNSVFKKFIRMALETFTDMFYRNNHADLGKIYTKRLLEWKD